MAPVKLIRFAWIDPQAILWVADIAYVPIWAGFLYLAVVLDAFSRRIIGWAMGNDQKAQLVIDAMNMAVTQRKPGNIIHHSDQGSQYTSVALGLRCKEMGVRPSMGKERLRTQHKPTHPTMAAWKAQHQDRLRS